MRTKRPAIDNITEQARVVAAASRPLVPPATVPLAAEDMAFFANIVDEFARVEWTAHQLELAAMLARTMADMAREQALLRDEGGVVEGPHGPIANPRRGVVQMYATAIMGFRRSLSLHARATQHDMDKVGKRRGIAKAIERGARQADDGSDLIATPH